MPGEQLLLINPRRRSKRRASTSVRRRHRRSTARRHHPRRHRVRSHVAHRGHRRYRVRAHMANPRHRRHYRRHRNPRDAMGGVVMPVAAGAIGAVGLDILWGYLAPMFGTLFSGSAWMNLAAKAGLAVGASYGVGKFTSRRTGNYVMIGALTVYGYELLESLIKRAAPTLPFAGVGAYMPGLSGLGGPNYNPAPYLGWSPAHPSSMPVPLSGFGAYVEGAGQPGLSGLGGGSSGMF